MRVRITLVVLALATALGACGDVVYRQEAAPLPPAAIDGGGTGSEASTSVLPPRNVETLYTGAKLDAFALTASELFVTGDDNGEPIVFRVPKEAPRKPWAFINAPADATTDRLRMAGTERRLYYEDTLGGLRSAARGTESPSAVHDRRLVDSLLAPKLAATSATRFAYLVHDGARTDLVIWGENTTRSETAIGKVGLDLGPVAIDEVLTVFVERPEEIVVRYAPEEGRTTLAKLPAAAVAMALDDAAIYVAVAGGRVLRVARTGGPPEELLAGLGAVKALATTGKQLLVLTEGDSARLIECDPRSCSATRRDLFDDVVRPVGLGLDASWIYVAERGPASRSGRVRHVERAP